MYQRKTNQNIIKISNAAAQTHNSQILLQFIERQTESTEPHKIHEAKKALTSSFDHKTLKTSSTIAQTGIA